MAKPRVEPNPEPQILTAAAARLQPDPNASEASQELQVQRAMADQLLENAPEAIVLVDQKMRILRLNPAFTRTFGYSEQEALGRFIDDLIVPAQKKYEGRQIAEDVLRGKTTEVETERCRKDGSLLFVSLLVTPIVASGGQVGYYAIYRDITPRKEAETLQSALYRITALSASTKDLRQLFSAIHGVVAELMYARNFYIALYDAAANTLTFAYAVDEADTFPSPDTPVPAGRGLTEYVLRTGKPLLASPQVFDRMVESGEAENVGAPSVDWLGVPLKDGDRTFGAIVLQSYTENVRFGEKEFDILTFVSQHIAGAITHKRNEEAVRASEAHFRALAETAASAIYIHTQDELLYVNRAIEDYTGYSRSELLGKDPWKLLHPEFLFLRDMSVRARIGDSVRREFKIVRKDGIERWWDFSGTFIEYQGQLALLGTALDVTERKRDELLQTALYRIAAQASSVGDLQELYSAIHEIVAELMYAKNFFVALRDPLTEIVSFPYFVDEKDSPPEPRKAQGALTDYLLRTGEPLLVTPEVRKRLHEAGEVRLIGTKSSDWMGVPLKDGYVTFGALVVQSYDLTHRFGENEKNILTFVSQQVANAIRHKQDLEATRESEGKFRAVAEMAPCAIFIYRDTRPIYVNQTSTFMTGYSREELLQMEIWDLVHPDFRVVAEEHARNRQAGNPAPTRYEFKFLSKQGQERWVDFSARAIPYQGGTAVLGIALDITDRKLAEEDLRVQRALLEQLFDSSPEAVLLLDLEMRIIRANREFTRMFGYPIAEVLGKPIDEVLVPEDLEEESRLFTQMVQHGDLISAETKRRRKDGSMVEVSVLGTPIEVGGRRVSYYGIYRDITARKAAERNLHELMLSLEKRVAERTAELEEANRELEAFSYSVSHDLRAPLRHIDGFVKLLMKREAGKLDAVSNRYFNDIAESSTRMGHLIDDLLALSRTSRTQLKYAPVDLTYIFQSVRSQLSRDLGERKVVWEIAALPRVMGDSALLQLVVFNLFSNALKYAAPREVTRISVGVHSQSEDEVTVFVRDNGVGFDMQFAHKLFGVFQRLHSEDEFEGTGIGLATVRRILLRHGGTVWGEGKLDKGATFYFTLKLAKELAHGSQTDTAG